MKPIALLLLSFGIFVATFSVSSALSKSPGQPFGVTWSSSNCQPGSVDVHISGGPSCGNFRSSQPSGSNENIGTTPSSGGCTAMITCPGASASDVITVTGSYDACPSTATCGDFAGGYQTCSSGNCSGLASWCSAQTSCGGGTPTCNLAYDSGFGISACTGKCGNNASYAYPECTPPTGEPTCSVATDSNYGAGPCSGVCWNGATSYPSCPTGGLCGASHFDCNSPYYGGSGSHEYTGYDAVGNVTGWSWMCTSDPNAGWDTYCSEANASYVPPTLNCPSGSRVYWGNCAYDSNITGTYQGQTNWATNQLPGYSGSALLVCNTSSGSWGVTSPTCSAIPPSATLSVPACPIPAGASTCSSNVTWSVTGYPTPLSVQQDGTQFSTAANLTVTRQLKYGSNNFNILDANSQTIAAKTVDISCVSGSFWDGGKCVSTTGTLSAASPSCTIATNANSCAIAFTWTTINPLSGYTSQVVADGGAGPNSTAINNDTQSLSIPYGSKTLRLYHNAQDLAQSTVSSDCSVTNAWGAGICQSCLNGSCGNGGPHLCNNGAVNPPACSQCPSGLAWDTGTNSCVTCAHGGCTGGGGNPGNPIGTLVCTNGATTPPMCDLCTAPNVYDLSSNSCIAPPSVGPVGITNQYTPSATFDFTCINSTKYEVWLGLRGVGTVLKSSTLYSPDADGKVHPVVTAGTLGEGNYSIYCNRGAVYSAPAAKYYRPTMPTPPVITLNASPKTIQKGGNAVLSWKVDYPTASCGIKVSPVCSGSAVTTQNGGTNQDTQTLTTGTNCPVMDAQQVSYVTEHVNCDLAKDTTTINQCKVANAAAITTILQSMSEKTDASDPNNALRGGTANSSNLLGASFYTPLAHPNTADTMAAGQKTFIKMKYTIDFGMDCPATQYTVPKKVRVNVTSSNEG